MSNYNRPHQPDSKLFFMVRLLDRNSNLLVREVERLRAATRQTLQTLPFEIDEIVVLPAVPHQKIGVGRRSNTGKRGYGNAAFGNTICVMMKTLQHIAI